jgi:hypothetical protein
MVLPFIWNTIVTDDIMTRIIKWDERQNCTGQLLTVRSRVQLTSEALAQNHE